MMENLRWYYFGFYREYSIKNKPVICQVVESIDSLSCELLGGDYPILEVSLSRKEIKQYAAEIASRYHAFFIEINQGRRYRIS